MTENIESIIGRIEKLEFHVKLLAESSDYMKNPIASLVIDFNWSEQDLNCAHDIFEKFDEKIRNEQEINWKELEIEFNTKLKISYQCLKSVILAFNRNGQWIDVCYGYVSHFGESVPLELKSIVFDNVR